MANFQKMTLMIACIILLICIVIIILIFLFPNTKQVWPPLVANCPDYFTDVKGDGSECVNNLSLGTYLIQVSIDNEVLYTTQIVVVR